VKGGAYLRAIRARNPSAVVTQAPCPLFVALAEEGLTDGPIPEMVAQRYLAPLLNAEKRPDALVLGCTHFPALAEVIGRVAGSGVTLVDSARTTAEAVARLLASQQLVSTTPAATPRFLATDSPERFARVGEIFLGKTLGPVELVDLQRS
jgi:glutamate racemase